MMKFEKLVKGGLAAVMALSMAACSGSGSSADTSTPAANDGAATDAAAAPAETTAAAAGAFKLGLSGPLTGGAFHAAHGRLPPSCTVENHVYEAAPKPWGRLFCFVKNVTKTLVSEEDSTLRV